LRVYQRVQRTETGPLAELLAIGNLDKGDLVLGAQSNDELLVCLLLASLVENAHVRLTTVKGLGGLAQTTGKSVVDEGELQDTLESLEDAHLALTAGSIGRDLDLGGRADLGLGIVFSVRLVASSVMFLRCEGRGSSAERYIVLFCQRRCNSTRSRDKGPHTMIGDFYLSGVPRRVGGV
jgi:hypothetical protein